jgi:hypothetical protein
MQGLQEDVLYEDRINLALSALQSNQVPSLRKAAVLYRVAESTLRYHQRGYGFQRNAQVNNRKLTATEEKVLLQRIILLDNRGLSPSLPFVRRMADLLLREREPSSSVGKNWLTRFVQRHNEFTSKFLRKYDYQRAKCNDPAVIQPWFDLVRTTIEKYGILMEDIYNFDETGFLMGVIATQKVVTQTRLPTSKQLRVACTKAGRPKVTQPGNRNWVTAIECINASGWAVPSVIIFEGKVHQSSWYQTGIPRDWVIGLSENGWTDNELGYKWLTEVFDRHTRTRTVGRYRLLLLDGHKSHFTPEFSNFCEANSIIWLCYPPHSTDQLQALDVGYFSLLKGSYGQLVKEKAELGVHHIDKADFLTLFHQARTITMTEKNIKSAFEAVGIVPYNPQKVLARLKVKTPSPILGPRNPELQDSANQLPLRTPQNIVELDAQARALEQRLRAAGHGQSSPTDQALHYLVKSAQMTMHSAALLAEENRRLHAENDRQKRKRNAQRSYIATGGVLAVADGLQLIEERVEGQQAGSVQRRQTGQRRAQRHCSKCRSPGHTARTCSEA